MMKPADWSDQAIWSPVRPSKGQSGVLQATDDFCWINDCSTTGITS